MKITPIQDPGEEPLTVNRGIITVIPKQPFFEWFNKLAPDMPVQLEEFKENNGYLVTGNFADWEKVLKDNYRTMFENELWGMWTEPAAWPVPRTFGLFKDWVDTKVSAIVYDLGSGPLQQQRG
ncbi:MAG TPA: hypothetical protein DCP28_22505 [Cytophagales bacterium]|nr:hypothetical protein [Cytophagales bacterium]